MPQQVCPSGNFTVTPRRRRTVTAATPTSGKNMSPRQVIMSEALTGMSSVACTRCVRRRRRDDHKDEERFRTVVDEPVLHSGGSDQCFPRRQPLLRIAEREPPGPLQYVVDLVLD